MSSRPLLCAVLAGALASLASHAAADIASPGDEYCDVEIQQRDGSRCEACTIIATEQYEDGEDPCAALRTREGWSMRCSRGATVNTTIYCDRAANFVEVGGGTPIADGTPVEEGVELAEEPGAGGGSAPSGCGCRVSGPAPVQITAAFVAALALTLGRRRRR